MSEGTPENTPGETPEETPLSRSKGMRWTSHLLFGMNVAALVLMGVLGAWVAGIFRGIFEENLVAIPVLTKWILAVPGWGYLALFGGLAALLVVKERAIKNRTVTASVEMVMVLFITVVLVLYVIGVGWPLVKMVISLRD